MGCKPQLVSTRQSDKRDFNSYRWDPATSTDAFLFQQFNAIPQPFHAIIQWGSLSPCCIFVIFIHIKKTWMIWTADIAFQIQTTPLPLKLCTKWGNSAVLAAEETILSPVPGKGAFLVLLCIVERWLYPREGSAGWIVSISVICSPNEAPQELPLSLLFYQWGCRVANTRYQPSLHSLPPWWKGLSALLSS